MRSLSPKRISWVATVSFSFTTGIAPSCISLVKVRSALRKPDCLVRSSTVSSTWPTSRPCSANRAS